MDLLPGWLGSYSDSLKSFSSSPLLNESVNSGSDIGALLAWMLLQGQYEPFWQGQKRQTSHWQVSCFIRKAGYEFSCAFLECRKAEVLGEIS